MFILSCGIVYPWGINTLVEPRDKDKSTHLVTNEGRSYILDSSLDTVSEQIDPQRFFRISRNCTISLKAIQSIAKHPSNRLKVLLRPQPDFEVFVSRSRTSDFIAWLEGKA